MMEVAAKTNLIFLGSAYQVSDPIQHRIVKWETHRMESTRAQETIDFETE